MGNRRALLISIAIWVTCIALPVVHALDISRRYGAEWQQYYGERIDTDDDYAYDYGAQPFGDGAYFQQLSGELPDRSDEQVARPASSNELTTFEVATPDLTGESSDDNDQTCVTGTYSPSGSNCSAFHVCRRSRLTEVSCPSDMWFDPRHRDDVLCNYPEVVCAADNSVCDCADKYPPLPPDPLLEPGVTCRADQRFHFTASQVDCRRYFVCFDEHVRRLECREGMQYNPESEQCDYPEIVNCQIIDPDCPLEGVSFLPHAELADAFYLCVHGYKTLQTCPFYHVWDAETNACRPREEIPTVAPKQNYNYHNGYY